MSAPLHAVVLAGGGGSRLWPLSRRARPKQCLSFGADRSLLQQTVDRLAPLVPLDRVLVVTGPDMADAVRADLPELAADQVLVEPHGRNTAPCVGWAAVEVARRAGARAPLAVLPADHGIARPQVFRDALAVARDAAVTRGAIVTLGIAPDRPATGYGYLQLGALLGATGPATLHAVDRFVEKPDRARAEAFLADGGYRWNAGVFVARADALRAAFAAHLPRTAAALDRIAARPAALAEAWADTDATSLDYGVMERARGVLSVSCDPGWSDLGAWDQVEALYPPAPGGRGRARAVLTVDSEGCLVHAVDKTVALVGLRSVIVVDTADALLVLDRERAQDVREILEQLAARGDSDLL